LWNIMRRGKWTLVVGALALVFAAAAAASWAGSDPAHNYRLGSMPSACQKAPRGKVCINAGVYYLDKARAKLGLPAYALPADFPSLTPAEQAFILTNLDRLQYGLPPIPGLSGALNRDAYSRGVRPDADPSPSSTAHLIAWNANWAGWDHNIVEAYENWMYNDGMGSGNIDCTQSNHRGCWGHRHNVLWKFGRTTILAMGAAGGKGRDGKTSFAMLLVGGSTGYAPSYTYTWTKAVADGAGTNVYNPRG
jgi:hypothetical protein